MKIQNTQGKIFYGIHFYPGVAEYREEGQEPYRVFLNENTLRDMDPTFAGKPIFVEHVDEVDPDLNKLRSEADGWVIESFFNASDGKHWVKFIVVSDQAERAIRNGMRLSNAYIPRSFKDGGLWNGVHYDKEITAGEYEHLAIVKDPRYEESKILTPEEFKLYNEEQVQELKKIANSQKKGTKMKLSFFKRTKVENAIEPDMEILLPKSGKTVTLEALLNAYEKEEDKAMGEYPEVEKGKMKGMKASSKKNVSGSSDDDEGGESAKHHTMADMNHMVKMHDGSYMKVKDMMSKHRDMMDEMEEMKGKKKDSVKDSEEHELDLEMEPSAVDAEGDLHNYDADSEHSMDKHEEQVASEEKKMELKDDLLEHPEEPVHDAEDPEKDMEAKEKALQLVEHEDEELEEAKKKKDSKKKNAAIKADRLKNAQETWLNSLKHETPQTVELSYDRVQRGRTRYGSG